MKKELQMLLQSNGYKKRTLTELGKTEEQIHHSAAAARAAYLEKLKEDLEEVKKMNAESMQTIESLKKQLEIEKELQQKSKRTLEDFQRQIAGFMQQMLGFAEQSNLKSLSEHASELTENNNKCLEAIENWINRDIGYHKKEQERDLAASKHAERYLNDIYENIRENDINVERLFTEAKTYEVDNKSRLKEVASECEMHEIFNKIESDKSLIKLENTLSSDTVNMGEMHNGLEFQLTHDIIIMNSINEEQ